MNAKPLERTVASNLATAVKKSRRRKVCHIPWHCDHRRRFGTVIGNVWRSFTFGNRHRIKYWRTESRGSGNTGWRNWLSNSAGPPIACW